MTLLCRCDAMGDAFQDLYLIPSVDKPGFVRIKEDDSLLAKGKRLEHLSHLKRLASLVAEGASGLIAPVTIQ